MVSTNSSSSSVVLSAQAPFTAPPMTIMYTTTGAPSTIPEIGTNTASPPSLTTLPFAESLMAKWGNPYSNPLQLLPSSGSVSSLNSYQLSVQSTCSAIWSSSYVQWFFAVGGSYDSLGLESPEGDSIWTPRNITSCNSDCPATVPYSLCDPSNCRTLLDYSVKEFPYTAPRDPPCCSSCTFTAGDVQVYHWPVTTGVPTITELVNTEGFTFSYPSIYVAFEKIQATDLCGIVGPAINNIITIGFDATELSTAASHWTSVEWFPDTQTDVITNQAWWTYSSVDERWQDEYNPPFPSPRTFEVTNSNSMVCTDIESTVWRVTRVARYDTSSTDYTIALTDRSYLTYPLPPVTMTYTPELYTITYNPCTPWLSVPSRVLTMYPEWESCVKNLKGLHDPPNHLTVGAAFQEVTAADPFRPATATKKPSPAQIIQNPAASKTASSGTDNSLAISKLPAVITLGAKTITANSVSTFVIGTHSLGPGQAITESGTVLSMASDESAVIFDGTSTQILKQVYAIGIQVLSAGGPGVTVSGIVVSLEAGGKSFVIGGSVTEDIRNLMQGVTSIAAQTLSFGGPAATVAGIVMSVNHEGETIVLGRSTFGTQTLSAGGPKVTVSGIVMSVDKAGETVVVGGVTKTGTGLGGMTTSAAGHGGKHENSASARNEGRHWRLWILVLCTLLGISVYR